MVLTHDGQIKEGLSALLNRPMGVALAPTALPSLDWISGDYSSFDWKKRKYTEYMKPV